MSDENKKDGQTVETERTESAEAHCENATAEAKASVSGDGTSASVSSSSSSSSSSGSSSASASASAQAGSGQAMPHAETHADCADGAEDMGFSFPDPSPPKWVATDFLFSWDEVWMDLPSDPFVEVSVSVSHSSSEMAGGFDDWDFAF